MLIAKSSTRSKWLNIIVGIVVMVIGCILIFAMINSDSGWSTLSESVSAVASFVCLTVGVRLLFIGLIDVLP